MAKRMTVKQRREIVQTELRACISIAHKARDEARKVAERKGSAAEHLMAAAIAAKDRAEFTEQKDALYDAIRSNADGIAVELNCDSKTKGEETTWMVSGYTRNLFSVIDGALEYKVPLTEGDDVRPFGDVRKDVTEARAIAKLDDETDGERKLREARTLLDTLNVRLGKAKGEAKAEEQPTLDAIHAGLTDLLGTLREMQPKGKPKAKTTKAKGKGKALEEAAAEAEAEQEAEAA